MNYRAGFKYQLAEPEVYLTDIRPEKSMRMDFIILHTSGVLELLKGFAWDGASGPVIDRKSNIRASAVHDALYRLIRESLLAHDYWLMADKEYAKCLEKDGAWPVTIKIDLIGLKIANGAAAHPRNKQKIIEILSE